MSNLECEVQFPPVKGLEENKLTVGRHVSLSCKGEISPEFNLQAAHFKSEPESALNIKIFSIQKVTGGINIDFTYYVTGGQELSRLILTDGTLEMALSGPNLNVESVIVPPTDGKAPQPFGPIFPVAIETPLYYWLALVVSLITIAIYSAVRLRRYTFYRRLKIGLKQYQSPVQPEEQFYKSMRKAEKKEFDFAEIERAFRVYSLRTYDLPMFDLDDEKVIKYFRHNRPQNEKERAALARILSDSAELKPRFHNLNEFEKAEFVKKLFRFVENKDDTQKDRT